jgi:hypothetical protein
MHMENTRQQFLTAWRNVLPQLSPDVVEHEIAATANAMRALSDVGDRHERT